MTGKKKIKKYLHFNKKIITFAMSQKYQNKYIKIMDIEKPYREIALHLKKHFC